MRELKSVTIFDTHKFTLQTIKPSA